MNSDTEVDPSSLPIGQQIERLHTIADPVARSAATDLVASVLELHRSALQRMLELLRQTASTDAAKVLAVLENDELVRAVLLLHDLHSKTASERMEQVLKDLQPRLAKYGATAEVIRADETSIRIRIGGMEKGCGSTSEMVRSMVESSLTEAAPDAGDIVVESVEIDRSFVRVESIQVATATTGSSK